MKNISVLFFAYVVTCFHICAGTLATPTFDGDSYIFVKTNNEFDATITLNTSQQGTASHPHFNFAMMTFDVAGLNAAGDKYLRLSAEGYTNGAQGGAIGPTGSAEVHLVALDTSVASYFAPGSGQDWYDTHVQNPGVTVLGTYSFTNQQTLYVDVTATVNAWIANGASNYGFALFSSSGAVEIASMNHADASLWPALTDVAPVPSGWLVWQSAQFPGLPANSGPYDDFDCDGVQNLIEYISGSDPKSAASFILPELSNEAGYMTLTMNKAAGVNGFSLSIEASEDLETWNAATTVVTNNASMLKVRINTLITDGAHPRAFLRTAAAVTP